MFDESSHFPDRHTGVTCQSFVAGEDVTALDCDEVALYQNTRWGVVGMAENVQPKLQVVTVFIYPMPRDSAG
jgi:hypothetical protein